VLRDKQNYNWKVCCCVSDLHGIKNRNIEDLSGGELQRFAIAIVCIQRADVYVAQRIYFSDVKRGKTSRPRPELRGRGQFLEVEAKKYQIMINNIQLRLRLNAGKINKIPEFYTIFA